jgi:hypothetical protein
MTDEDAILAANAAYYVFGGADFAGTSEIWADDDVSCVHPGWPVLIGRQKVLQSYRNILGNPTEEQIAHQDEQVLASGVEARVLCVEIVGELALAATNWFRRIDGAWRMIHHQPSPLAARIQQAPQPPPGRLN